MELKRTPHVAVTDTVNNVSTLIPTGPDGLALGLAVSVAFTTDELGVTSLVLGSESCYLEGTAPGEYDLVPR